MEMIRSVRNEIKIRVNLLLSHYAKGNYGQFYLNPRLRKSSQRLELLSQVDVRVFGVRINFLQHLDLLLREVGPLSPVSQYCDALFRTLRGIRRTKVVVHFRRP